MLIIILPPSLTPQYRVFGRSGATIRQGYSMPSPIVGVAPLGSILRVSAVRGRRAKVIHPYKGWASISTPNGYIIISKRAMLGQDFPRYVVTAEGGVLIGSSRDPAYSGVIRLAKKGEILVGTGCVTTDSEGQTRVQVEEGWVTSLGGEGTHELKEVPPTPRQ